MKNIIRFGPLVASLAWISTVPAQDLKPGFDQAQALDMASLICDMNGSGISSNSPPKADANCPEIRGWTLAWDNGTKAKDINNPQPCDTKDKGFCGIKPFNNRWKIWQKPENLYALVIRGTIGDAQSIISDALATSLPAESIYIKDKKRNKAFTFTIASVKEAEVHMGFAYSLAALMFNKDQGILKALQELPKNSQIYIAGHSQGAAIATLAHAFLLQALSDGKYGLDGKGFTLKSYVFAQPKPGNWKFALAYAEKIGNKGMSYTINNIGDWVPQVPLSIQFVSGTLDQIAGNLPLWATVAQGLVGGPLKLARETVAKQSAETANKVNEVSGEFDEKYFTAAESSPSQPGSSLDYMPVGVVLGVGPCDQNTCKKDPSAGSDPMYEHHIYNYIQLTKGMADANP